MSRDPVTVHRYPMNVEQAQDRGTLFSLGRDHTQVKSGFVFRKQMLNVNPYALVHVWDLHSSVGHGPSLAGSLGWAKNL